MIEDKRFMNELVRIVGGALRLDIDKVRNYTAFLADKLEAAEDPAAAARLRKLLAEADVQLRPADARFVPTVPVDEESRYPLIEAVNLQDLEEPAMQLPEKQWAVVNEFLSVAKSYASFEDADLSGALSFLMYGPPGTGKSRLARYIASELGMPLYVARLDGLISSFLGSTSKNIRSLFEFAARTPCILFLDEFDAIAKLRADDQELGELKRVVNSFLQNLDTLGRQSIVLGATNHESLLDAAVWRRFTYRAALQLPDNELRLRMWEEFFAPIELEMRELKVLADLSEGFSGSDIRETCVRLKRRHYATKEPTLLSDIFPVLQNLAIAGESSPRYLSNLDGVDDSCFVHTLRERNKRLYSHSTLAALLGVSKATVQRLLKQEFVTHG